MTDNTIYFIHYRMCSIEEMPKRVAIETVSRLSADTFNAIPHEDDAMDGLDEEVNSVYLRQALFYAFFE